MHEVRRLVQGSQPFATFLAILGPRLQLNAHLRHPCHAVVLTAGRSWARSHPHLPVRSQCRLACASHRPRASSIFQALHFSSTAPLAVLTVVYGMAQQVHRAFAFSSCAIALRPAQSCLLALPAPCMFQPLHPSPQPSSCYSCAGCRLQPQVLADAPLGRPLTHMRSLASQRPLTRLHARLVVAHPRLACFAGFTLPLAPPVCMRSLAGPLLRLPCSLPILAACECCTSAIQSDTALAWAFGASKAGAGPSGPGAPGEGLAGAPAAARCACSGRPRKTDISRLQGSQAISFVVYGKRKLGFESSWS